MKYSKASEILKSSFYAPGQLKMVPELGISISHHNYSSLEGAKILPGYNKQHCKTHKQAFLFYDRSQTSGVPVLDVSDYHISTNRSFSYHIVKNTTAKKNSDIIMMFHGLNERLWDKYLPWAYGLSRETGKTIILFPLAFHMDRAPDAWIERNSMQKVAEMRKEKEDNTACSFVNAAISSRLESNPQRLFWSGFQTYLDVIQLIKIIRNGKIKVLPSKSKIDIFGYSIGSILSMTFMMGNPGKLFSDSKLFCFCGGMTLDRMFPISKFILDSRAATAIQQKFNSLSISNFFGDKRLAHYLDDKLHASESWFKSLLRYNFLQDKRENRIMELSQQIKSMVLRRDEVTPAVEALNTLQGGYRNLNLDVQVEDFAHPYSHVNPFPSAKNMIEEVEASFKLFIQSASEFFHK